MISRTPTASANYGAADVTLVGNNVGMVRGSLLIDSSDTTITFVKTGGVLANDSYTVTLVSGDNAFHNVNGTALDGNSDGTNGDNSVSSFSVSVPSSNLAASVALPGRGIVRTGLDDNQGALTLTPAPTNGVDPVDGLISIPAPAPNAPAPIAGAEQGEGRPLALSIPTFAAWRSQHRLATEATAGDVIMLDEYFARVARELDRS